MIQVDPDLTESRPPAGMDAGTKRLALFAGGIGALLVAMVGGWSLLGHHQAGIPIIAPPPGPVRVKPVDPGGMQVMGAQALPTADGSGTQALAPGPEAAAPQALQAEVDAARRADAPPPKPFQPAPGRVGGAGPTASPPSAPVPAAALPPAAAIAPTAPAPVARPAAPAAAPAGAVEIQLAAVDTEAAAHAEWARLSHQAPGLFAGRTPLVQRVTRGSKEFYRVRTGGFATPAEASAFCGRARAQGIACTLADF